MEPNPHIYNYDGSKPLKITKWKTGVGSQLLYNSVIFSYKLEDAASNTNSKDPFMKYKSNVGGTVVELLASEGDLVLPGSQLLKVEPCTHPVIMKDLCAECGADLRNLDRDNFEKLTAATTFSMVHVVPELKVSLEQAEKLGRDDETRLLKNRKLVLLVDLDQTLIHTTNDNVPKDLLDVHHFQLYGRHSPWYHTRLRPGTKAFLEKISKFYELHICTFGARLYAHKIAQILDPGGELFSHRILSRDECFDATSKTGNLKALFPRGDDMVCIIDDREDVWNFAPNVVHVKPYCYFHNTGDINAPPNSLPEMNPIEESKVAAADDPGAKNEPSEETPKESGSINNEDRGGKESAEIDRADVSTTDNGEIDPDCCSDKMTRCKENTAEPASSKDRLVVGNDSQIQSTVSSPTSEFRIKEGQFKESQNDKDKTTKSDISSEFCSGDDYLLYLEEILENIHREYYKRYDKMKSEGKNSIPDLKLVVPEVRRNVLKGCNIVFSSVIPTNLHPETSRFWTLAESLGANVSIELVLDSSEKRTTHVVASKLGTAKVNAAKRHEDILIVSVDWLFCCAERWERAAEQLFPLTKDVTPPFLDGNNKFEASVENSFFDPKMGKPYKVWPGSKRSHNSSGKRKGKNIKNEEEFSERIFVEAGLSLSLDDIEDMDREIEEACSEESDKDSNASTDSSSEESLSSADYPRGWKRPKRDMSPVEEEDCDESSDAETIGSVDEEMAEAVKKEFGS